MINQDVFKDEIKDFTLFHIPHSSTFIPDYTGFIVEKIDHEIQLLTDFATDKMFDVEGINKLVVLYSRVFCDVERLPDSLELLFKVGRGIYYTHCDNGDILRETNPSHRAKVIREYYDKHHAEFEKIVSDKLNEYGTMVIIDCHSFSDIPFKTDLDQSSNRPDICIGTDEFHTPKYLINSIINSCREFNFSYKIDSPYVGTIVPMKYYGKDNRVKSVMIEINRKLYMNDGKVEGDKVQFLREFINHIFN